MERADIVEFLKSFVKQQKSEVNYGTYRETGRSSLLNDGLSTRANSVWKQSQFVVAYSDNDKDSIDDYLRGWAELTRGIYDQYLILECPNATWTVYDKTGKELRLEDLKNVPQKSSGNVERTLLNVLSDTGSLQTIYYGAPGTGKSHCIKDNPDVKAADAKGNVFRTTFHPDSDYSTFVGAYKPTMKNKEPLHSPSELISRLTQIKTSGVTYPCHKFAARYWESLKDLTADEIKRIVVACGFTETMNVEVSKGIAIGQELANNPENQKITYSFVPQTFLQAYIAAWKQPEENVYLVIEEINRGNCAQIFGDLFQLLDRGDNGESEYPIMADNDLRAFLERDENLGKDSEGIRGGKLKLPKNLHILATMNTSDQSLFPIDSAFKRRWEWKYMKIKNMQKDYRIIVNGTPPYDWWNFVEKMNNIIGEATASEDKKMGYFFCKPNLPDNGISAEQFVSKALFYIYGDALKDYPIKDEAFKKSEKDGKVVYYQFSDFYDENGDVDKTTVAAVLDKFVGKAEEKKQVETQ